MNRLRMYFAIVFVLTLAFSIQAQPSAAAVPSPESFLGYPAGESFTPWHRIVEYFDALDHASPLVNITRFGETNEGRPLIYALVTSAENMSKIDSIRERIDSIAHPDRTSRAVAEEIAQRTPAIVWLAFEIHGNESSSAEAAMIVAHRLAAGGTDVRAILESCVVIIDPLQNPDGRERYVQWYRQARGVRANPDPRSWEHSEPWPGGRFNHYLIDMNRDWAWLTQKETRARVVQIQKWNPQVFVDFHEMSAQSSYFFPPAAQPINANIGGDVQKWLEMFGRANGDAFTERGWPFFIREHYDLFYPGYGDSWPSLRGAVGMTYEMAGGGRAGSTILREDGAVMTLASRAEKHATTAMATLGVAAEHRKELVLRTYDALAESVRAPATTYLIAPGTPGFVSAIDLLRKQGIEVMRLDTAQKINASPIDGEGQATRTFPPGTAVVSTRQPLGALARSLLERSPDFPAEFIAEQQRKVDADEQDDFYDITAWSLAISHDLDAWQTKTMIAPVTPWSDVSSSSAPLRKDTYAFLVDGVDPHVYEFVGRLLTEGIPFSVSEADLSFGSISFARGTIVILRSRSGADVGLALQRIAQQTGARVLPIDSPWTKGISLGSTRIHHVRDPKIALVGGAGTSPESFGALWHSFDVELGIPHSVVPAERLGAIDLDQYRVLVMPDGNSYAKVVGKSDGEKLKEWVDSGGVIVAIKGASSFLTSKDVAISKLKTWPAKKEGDEEPEAERHNEYRIPGTAFRTRMNERSYLTFGLTRAPAVLIEGTKSFLAVSKKADNILTIVEKEMNPVLAGFSFPETLDRMSGAPFLVVEQVGSGVVITFADEPYFRMFWRATLPPLMNAVLYSATFER